MVKHKVPNKWGYYMGLLCVFSYDRLQEGVTLYD